MSGRSGLPKPLVVVLGLLLCLPLLIDAPVPATASPTPASPAPPGFAQTGGKPRPPAMTVTPTQPIVGEQTRFNGKVSTKKKRKIYLERRVGTKWQVVKKAKTTKRGTWSMTIPWRGSASTMRVRLPKKGKFKQLISASRVITPAKQSGLVVMPTWFEVGEKIVVTARFAPARSGRPVWLQARSGSS